MCALVTGVQTCALPISCSRAVKAKSATVSVPSEVSVVHHVPGELEQARGERAEPGEARIVGVSGQVPVMQLPEHGRQLELCQQPVELEQRDIAAGPLGVLPHHPFAAAEPVGGRGHLPRLAHRRRVARLGPVGTTGDRKSTRLNLQSLMRISYAVFCLKKKTYT